jgi:DNA modification methylase
MDEATAPTDLSDADEAYVDAAAADEALALPEQHDFYKMPAKFGHVPVAEEPLGWDPKRRFERLYPRVSLPFQVVERVEFGYPELEPNQLFFGDNLHIMRSLPSESIDLIYIDPPFFSQQTYNVLFGDQNELRSFKDIWEGGLNGYLVWLNARLYEMKRLLRETGVIVLHLDWHAGHYVKTEMDRLFGYERLVNEIVWRYKTFHGQVKDRLPRKHDTLLVYARGKEFRFQQRFDTDIADTIDGKRWRKYLVNGNQILGANMPMQDSRFTRFYRRWVREHGREPGRDDVVYEVVGQPLDTVWDIKAVDPKSEERIGYPTQKPEALVHRIIDVWSDPEGSRCRLLLRRRDHPGGRPAAAPPLDRVRHLAGFHEHHRRPGVEGRRGPTTGGKCVRHADRRLRFHGRALGYLRDCQPLEDAGGRLS